MAYGVTVTPFIAIWLLTDVDFKVSKFIDTDPLSPLSTPDPVTRGFNRFLLI
jgi:hypothetical protein